MLSDGRKLRLDDEMANGAFLRSLAENQGGGGGSDSPPPMDNSARSASLVARPDTPAPGRDAAITSMSNMVKGSAMDTPPEEPMADTDLRTAGMDKSYDAAKSGASPDHKLLSIIAHGQGSPSASNPPSDAGDMNEAELQAAYDDALSADTDNDPSWTHPPVERGGFEDGGHGLAANFNPSDEEWSAALAANTPNEPGDYHYDEGTGQFPTDMGTGQPPSSPEEYAAMLHKMGFPPDQIRAMVMSDFAAGGTGDAVGGDSKFKVSVGQPQIGPPTTMDAAEPVKTDAAPARGNIPLNDRMRLLMGGPRR